MNRLRELRGDKTQQKVADEIGIPRATYKNYETGIREPDNAMLGRLADYFGVSVDYLLERSDSPTLTIPPVLKGVQVAFHDGLDSLTQEDINDVAEYIEFLRNKRNK